MVSLHRPESTTDEALASRHAAEHVDEQADGVVGDVGGEHSAGVGDEDATARALAEVNEVDARGEADDAAEGRDSVEEHGVHACWAGAHDDGGQRGLLRGSCGGEEVTDTEWLARREEVEDAETLAQRSVEGGVLQADEKKDDGLRRRSLQLEQGLAAGRHQ